MNTSPRNEATSSSSSSSRSTRTPYWEWIRSNKPHESLLGYDYSPNANSSFLLHSEESEEDDDDEYAFYYSHPDRIVYQSHLPTRMARRQLRRAAENSGCGGRCLLKYYYDQRERDSLATMVDDESSMDPSGSIMTREFVADYETFSDSGNSLESDETAADEEDWYTGIPHPKNAGTQQGDTQLPEMMPKGGAVVSVIEARQHQDHGHWKGRKPNRIFTDKPNPLSRRSQGPGHSKTKNKESKKGEKEQPPTKDELPIGKLRSRLSFLRLFNSDRERSS